MESFLTELFVDEITMDMSLQSRVGMDAALTTEYADIIKEHGYIFSIPLETYFDGDTKTYWLIDGFHRLTAARKSGIQKVKVRCIHGTYDDALYACTLSNIKNGRQRTKEDREKAVRMMLLHPKGQGVTDGVIAKRLSVTTHAVKQVRKAMMSSASPPPPPPPVREGCDGKGYTAERKQRVRTTTDSPSTPLASIVSDVTPTYPIPDGMILVPIDSCYHVPNCNCHIDDSSDQGAPSLEEEQPVEDIAAALDAF